MPSTLALIAEAAGEYRTLLGPLGYHWTMARTQTIVQLSDDLLAELDVRRAREGRSRSDLIREAIEAYLADDRAAAIDRAIVDGYTRMPPTEDFGATGAVRASLQSEPWEDPPARDDDGSAGHDEPRTARGRDVPA